MDRGWTEERLMDRSRVPRDKLDTPPADPLGEVVRRRPRPVGGHLVVTDHAAQESPVVGHEELVGLGVVGEHGGEARRLDRIEFVAEGQQRRRDR